MVPLALNIFLCIISAFGLLLNGYILAVIVLTKQAATANNVLVLHLGAVGALLCCSSLLGLAPGAACAAGGLLGVLLHPVALWTVAGLNCDRYCAIAAPLHYTALVSPKKVACGLAGAWAGALLLSAPPLLGAAPLRASAPLGACTPDWAAPGALWYCLLYTTFTLLLPAGLVLVCNLKILMIARYHRHRIASAIYEVTLSAQVTITHQRNPFFVPIVTAPNAPRVRNRSAISTVLQLVGSLFLLYFPYYIVILWQSISSIMLTESNGKIVPLKLHSHLITIATSFLTCSAPINGVLYGIKSKVLRKTFQNYWRKKMMKSEMNQEIQARTPSTCGSRRPSITPLSMMNKPCLQRRLSEALLDVGRSGNSLQRNNKIKRIASENAWKSGLTFGGLDTPAIPKQERAIAHTASCNTLQVPSSDPDNNLPQLKNDEVYMSLKSSFKSQDHSNPRMSALPAPRPAMSTANLILQKVFGAENPIDNVSTKRARLLRPPGATPSTTRRSPRILITRAFSEESDKSPSLPGSPSRDAMSRKYSCSTTTLLERKWKILRYQDEVAKMETDSDSDFCDVRKEIKQHEAVKSGEESDNCEGNSDSSGGEDEGRKYVSLEERLSTGTGRNGLQETTPEEQMLLSWPTTKRKSLSTRPNGIIIQGGRANGFRNPIDLSNVQCHQDT